MGKVVLNISMSLDGFSAGANIRPEEPMGDNGERLHDWMFSGEGGEASKPVVADFFENTGAYIMGNRTLRLGIDIWGSNPPFHAPCFVLAGSPRNTVTRQGGTSYIFVTGGVESALEQAREAAGDKDVVIMGGADAARQYLNARLIDEIYLHIAHVLLGSGTRLFDKLTVTPAGFERIGGVETPGATHIRFRV